MLHWGKHSLGPLWPLWKVLHDVYESVGPVPGWADVDAEEVLLGGGGHGERVPLQLRDGRAVEEDVLTHIHLKPVPHQLQLQHLGWMHHDLKKEWTGEMLSHYKPKRPRMKTWIMTLTYLPVLDCLHVANETQQTFTQVQNHRTNHPPPGLKTQEKKHLQNHKLCFYLQK